MILTFVKCGLTHFLNLQWKSQPWGKGKATIFTLGVFSNIKTGIWRHWKWLGRRAVRAASQLQFTSNQGEFFIPCLSTSGACGCQWLALCILSSQAAESTELRFSFACKRFIPWESGSPYSTLFFNVFFFFFFLEFKSNNNYRKGPARLLQMNEFPLKKSCWHKRNKDIFCHGACTPCCIQPAVWTLCIAEIVTWQNLLVLNYVTLKICLLHSAPLNLH